MGCPSSSNGGTAFGTPWALNAQGTGGGPRLNGPTSWDGGTLFNKIKAPKRMGRPKGQGAEDGKDPSTRPPRSGTWGTCKRAMY